MKIAIELMRESMYVLIIATLVTNDDSSMHAAVMQLHRYFIYAVIGAQYQPNQWNGMTNVFAD